VLFARLGSIFYDWYNQAVVKIQSKNIAEPVKQQLEEYLSRDDIYEQQESPFRKAINQTVDMFKATKVDIKLIEPEVTYKAQNDLKF
jgi:hypothetical protein